MSPESEINFRIKDAPQSTYSFVKDETGQTDKAASAVMRPPHVLLTIDLIERSRHAIELSLASSEPGVSAEIKEFIETRAETGTARPMKRGHKEPLTPFSML